MFSRKPPWDSWEQQLFLRAWNLEVKLECLGNHDRLYVLALETFPVAELFDRHRQETIPVPWSLLLPQVPADLQPFFFPQPSFRAHVWNPRLHLFVLTACRGSRELAYQRFLVECGVCWRETSVVGEAQGTPLFHTAPEGITTKHDWP